MVWILLKSIPLKSITFEQIGIKWFEKILIDFVEFARIYQAKVEPEVSPIDCPSSGTPRRIASDSKIAILSKKVVKTVEFVARIEQRR